MIKRLFKCIRRLLSRDDSTDLELYYIIDPGDGEELCYCKGQSGLMNAYAEHGTIEIVKIIRSNPDSQASETLRSSILRMLQREIKGSDIGYRVFGLKESE